MKAEKPKQTPGRKVGRYMLLNLIPFYPVYGMIRSMKDAAGSGKETLKDINERLTAEEEYKAVVTFQEACDKRAADAMSIPEVARLCLRRKRISLACCFVSTCFAFGSGFGENYLAAVIGILFAIFFVMFTVKYEHQIWQIEEGMQHPDAPLGGFREFFERGRGYRRVLSAHLFE